LCSVWGQGQPDTCHGQHAYVLKHHENPIWPQAVSKPSLGFCGTEAVGELVCQAHSPILSCSSDMSCRLGLGRDSLPDVLCNYNDHFDLTQVEESEGFLEGVG
jgi:hypothetical protein